MLKRTIRSGHQGFHKSKRLTPVERLETRVLFAAFPVTTTADTGVGSLRQAILDANAAPGNDTITFAIGSGAQTISPATPLPDLTDATGVLIAGSTQPGFAAGVPVITIDGAGAGSGASAFNLTAGNNTIQGLIVQNFDEDQIVISGPGNDIVLGNVIRDSPNGAGINIAASDVRVGGPGVGDRNVITGNNGAGISVSSGSGTIIENNRVGTNAAGTAAAGNGGGGISIGGADDAVVINNVVSGNTGTGISVFVADGALVQGNFVGTNAAGTAALGNSSGILADAAPDTSIINNVISGNTGVGITGGPGAADLEIRGNTIGVNAAGTAALANGSAGIVLGGTLRPVIVDNQISANNGPGINFADNVSDAVIQSNLIGTAADGTTDLGNTGTGIDMGDTSAGTSNDALIGGTSAGLGNTIAFNGGPGIDMPLTGSGNSFLGNSIFSNDGLGIDLGTAVPSPGRTPNDTDDADIGANDLQNFPVLGSAVSSGGTTTVTGTLDSLNSTAFRIEFFSDTTGGAAAEGRTFLGFADVTTDATGLATFNTTLTASVATGQFVTATATNADGSTSEFSDPISIGTTGPDIQVSGNGVSITNGDDTPANTDFTAFGSATVGGAAINRTFSLTNTGQTALDLSAGGGNVTLGGPGAAQFAVFDQPNSATIQPGQTTTFSISFTPSSAGTQVATATIASNDPDENPFTFDISGVGTTPSPAPEIEITGNGNAIASGDTTPSPSDHSDFGNAVSEGSPVTRTFTVTKWDPLESTCRHASLSIL